MRVTLDTRTVGHHFATVGMIRAVGHKQVIREVDAIRPYGFVRAALDDARVEATARGYVIVETH